VGEADGDFILEDMNELQAARILLAACWKAAPSTTPPRCFPAPALEELQRKTGLNLSKPDISVRVFDEFASVLI